MQSFDKNPELVRAVKDRNLERVKTLLTAGADPNIRVRDDRGIANLLYYRSSLEIVRELLSHGARVDIQNHYNYDTPLSFAIKSGFGLEIAKEFLKHGASVHSVDRKGNTPLNIAVKKSETDLELIKELLIYGSDINRRNHETRLIDNYSSPLDNSLRVLAITKLLIKFTLLKKFNEDYMKVVNLDPYKNIELSSYLIDCVCEINQMNAKKVIDVSLYELVTKKFNTHWKWSNQLSVKLASMSFSVDYPIYNDWIADEIKPFIQRANLLSKLSKLEVCTQNQGIKGRKVILDLDSTYNITKYLSNNDLLIFIIAFDVSFEQDCQTFNLVDPDTGFSEARASNCVKRARLE